jgi:hypothetical protein
MQATVQDASSGSKSSISISGKDVTVGSLKASASLGAAAVLFLAGVALDDAATLEASKWDGKAVILAGRRGIKLSEVDQHRKKDDLWLIFHAPIVQGLEPMSEKPSLSFCVFNVSEYMDDHPGGASLLLDSAGEGTLTRAPCDFLCAKNAHPPTRPLALLTHPHGTHRSALSSPVPSLSSLPGKVDSTAEYLAVQHSNGAKKQLGTLVIGTLCEEDAAGLQVKLGSKSGSGGGGCSIL